MLNEGVDVPDAAIGVILSGSASAREFIQRLGRILRRSEGKQAVLYELVSRETREERTSERRRQTLRGDTTLGKLCRCLRPTMRTEVNRSN
ncbi:MAG: hypothetical protein R3F37_04430 [Candidatus Competibacteraceae bacterium]